MKTGGITLTLGTFPGGLWYDSKPTANISPGYGVRLSLMYGPVHWDMPKFWKKDAWKNKYSPGNIWFTAKLPFFVGPFLSVSIGKIGFYIGFKQNGWGENNSLLPSARSTSKRDI
jgi:hypothetical protein